MGTQDRKREQALERRGKKKQSDGAGRLAGLFGGDAHGAADWGAADAHAMQDVVTAMQALGGAVTFGLSRDGGAYMLTLLLDGERTTDWLGQSEDVNAWLENAVYLIRTASDK